MAKLEATAKTKAAAAKLAEEMLSSGNDPVSASPAAAQPPLSNLPSYRRKVRFPLMETCDEFSLDF